MRLAGYILLLLLALYFLFVKPYLLAKKIQLQVQGLSLSLQEGLRLQSFLLYAPVRVRTFHLYIKDLSLKPWQFQAGEISLIEVSNRPPSDRAFDYDFTGLTKIAGRVNLKVGKLYLSTNYLPEAKSLTLFIPQSELKGGRLLSPQWTQVHWLKGQKAFLLEVLPERVRIVEDRVLVDRAQLRSSLYQMEIKGTWRGKKGSFQAQGQIFPIEGRHFRIEGAEFTAEGTVEYTRLRALFEGKSGLELKGRRHYREIKFSGDYLWEWKKKDTLRAQINADSTSISLAYFLRDGVLQASFSDFQVDGELLSLKRRVFALASGQIRVDIKRHLLNLQAYAPKLQVEGQEIQNANLRVELDYRGKPRGSFDFSSSGPFYALYKGSFSENGLVGNAILVGYNFRGEGISMELSYSGQVSLQGNSLLLRGGGKLQSITYRDLSLGSGDYQLQLTGDAYQIEVSSDKFSLQGMGSLKDRAFSGRLLLKGMGLVYEKTELKSVSGELKLKMRGEELSLSGDLSGNLSRGRVTSKAQVDLDLQKLQNSWHGKAEGKLVDTRLGELFYREGQFRSKLEGDRVQVSFNFGQELKGEGYYHLREKSYRLEGFLKHYAGELSISSSYQVQGEGNSGRAVMQGTGLYKNFSFPLEARFEIKEDRLEGLVEGFTLKNGLLTAKVEGLRLYGSRKEGFLQLGTISFMLGQEKLVSVEFEKGIYREGRVSLKGRLSGAVEGRVEFTYSGGVKVFSQGVVDVGRTLSLVKTRVLTDGEGQILYRLAFDGKKPDLQAKSERLVLRSRHLALPLQGSLQVSLSEKGLSGKLSLQGNQRAYLLADLTGDQRRGKVSFQMANLPVLHRNEEFRTNLLLSGSGLLTSDYKSLTLSGKFSLSGLINLQKWARKKTTPSENYKRVNLDLVVESSEPLRVNMPEGFLYADLSAQVRGTLYEPDYRIKAYLKGGKLKYFDRDFFVRAGEMEFTGKESQMELTITTPTPNYNIIIHVHGNPQYPKAVVRSEPPRDEREVITALLLGGEEGESLIPVSGVLLSQLPQVGGLVKGAKSATGLDVKLQVYPSFSPTGEVGINAVISKDISERFSVEHKQSTLRDPRETYTGGEVRLTPNTSVGGRVYSDRTQEFKMRVRRKFDF